MKITWRNNSEIEFAYLVKKMRDLQKKYFHSRKPELLAMSKQAEKQVDEVIEGLAACGLFTRIGKVEQK